MGIQINGQTDTISAVDGALTVSGAELSAVTNLNATGIVTATSFSGPLTGNVIGNVTGNLAGNVTGNVTGNVNSSGVSTITTLRTGTIQTTAGKPILNSTGSILAVYYIKSSSTQTITSNTPTAVTGLTLTVTPSSSSSQFLVSCCTQFGGNGTYGNNRTHIFRGETSLIEMACYEVDYANNAQVYPTNLSVLDSPATTSSITYTVRATAANNSGGIFLNAYTPGVTNVIFGNSAHTQISENGAGHSWLKVMEVSG